MFARNRGLRDLVVARNARCTRTMNNRPRHVLFKATRPVKATRRPESGRYQEVPPNDAGDTGNNEENCNAPKMFCVSQFPFSSGVAEEPELFVAAAVGSELGSTSPEKMNCSSPIGAISGGAVSGTGSSSDENNHRQKPRRAGSDMPRTSEEFTFSRRSPVTSHFRNANGTNHFAMALPPLARTNSDLWSPLRDPNSPL